MRYILQIALRMLVLFVSLLILTLSLAQGSDTTQMMVAPPPMMAPPVMAPPASTAPVMAEPVMSPPPPVEAECDVPERRCANTRCYPLPDQWHSYRSCLANVCHIEKMSCIDVLAEHLHERDQMKK